MGGAGAADAGSGELPDAEPPDSTAVDADVLLDAWVSDSGEGSCGLAALGSAVSRTWSAARLTVTRGAAWPRIAGPKAPAKETTSAASSATRPKIPHCH